MSPNGANGVSSNKSATYADKLDAFRKSDAERDALVASLIADYEDLKVKIEEITDDYKNEVASRRMWQSKAASCEHNLEQALVEQKQVAVCVESATRNPPGTDAVDRVPATSLSFLLMAMVPFSPTISTEWEETVAPKPHTYSTARYRSI
jgi:hypothetical protein